MHARPVDTGTLLTTPIHRPINQHSRRTSEAILPPERSHPLHRSSPDSTLLALPGSTTPLKRSRSRSKHEGLRLCLLQLPHTGQVPPSQPVRIVSPCGVVYTVCRSIKLNQSTHHDHDHHPTRELGEALAKGGHLCINGGGKVRPGSINGIVKYDHMIDNLASRRSPHRNHRMAAWARLTRPAAPTAGRSRPSSTICTNVDIRPPFPSFCLLTN